MKSRTCVLKPGDFQTIRFSGKMSNEILFGPRKVSEYAPNRLNETKKQN